MKLESIRRCIFPTRPKSYPGIALLLALWLCAGSLQAGDVTIENARFELRGSQWSVNTTLRHEDSGWEHYADAWRVVTEQGEVLGTRTLYHPHVDEQPFTRSLSGIFVPAGVFIVFVEAHDKVHGWSKQRVRVDLRQLKGPGFSVNR